MAHQSISARAVQARIDKAAQEYGALIRDDHWTLQHAHDVLIHADRDGLDLFKIAGLAKAIACFQCSAD
ncbi:hypothetical protein P3W85_29790 [Cupriavidus basilensis]|uniref:Uncharacterized protein n=1 Tax=Cupriavidus basilensis TaxID=68895 RepID=A0ABT6AWX3_9BURK|nr:hypothetical protein [Cupriavidus basilensis]MDF3837115.1 hypothetical protein [Cupriavidus basilensis]